MTQKISVIVPCYNQAQYLDECLQSVLDQSYQNWECIIVNDGSPDNTEEVAKKWNKKDSRYKYIKQENGGLSSARNAGIITAQGEWILPLDADDKIGVRYMELAEKEFHKGYTVIYCEAAFFGNISGRWNLPTYQYQGLLRGNIIFCSAFYKKEKWADTGGYDENLKTGREDWDFWMTILSKKDRVKRIDYQGFYYRRKSLSMDTVLNDSQRIKSDIESYLYGKHIKKYTQEFGSPISILQKNNDLEKKLNLVEQKYNSTLNIIRKNLLTKLFFTISEKF